MADFAAFLLVSVSITLVVTQGTLFDAARARGPRLWRELLGCPLCLGVWVGMALWGLLGPAPTLLDHLPRWAGASGEALGMGCLTGVAALTLKLVWIALENVGE